nr:MULTISPECIES: PAS domain-containing sensor histidine kinase [Myxococcaceae]
MFLFWGPELVQFYNDAFRPSFGEGKHPRAMGQRGPECWPEIWDLIGPQIRDVMERAQPCWNENQLVPFFRNGRIEDIYWTYSYSPVFGEDGRVAGTLVVCTETTGTVLAHQRLAQAQRETELAREELQGVFMQAPIPMCILTGPEHVFTLANAPYVQLVGREVVGKSLGEAFTEQEAGFYRPLLDRVFQTGTPVVVREAPLLLPGPDGVVHERLIDVGYHPYRDGSGKPLGVLGVIQDVTAPTRARREMEALTGELRSAVHARDEFLSIASHELRTPLTGLKLQVQTARRTLARQGGAPLPPERVERLVEAVEHGLGRMARLVEDMLDISRIQSGRLQLQREPVDLVHVVRDTFERFSVQLAEVGSAATLQLPQSLVLWADRMRLEQVLTNLLTNAVRYAPGVAITVDLEETEQGALLRFHDAGPGIALENQERVFERFERLIPASHVSGLGLGLYIVREIVRAHGGSVGLQSEPGDGTRFLVQLPRGERP